MRNDQSTPASIAKEARQFRDSKHTLQLATLNEQHVPLASYTPFVIDNDECVSILTSRLARHTANLLESTQCSVMLIQGESGANNYFARQRLSLLCNIRHHTRDSDYFAWLTQAMEQKFGAIAKQISLLPDFEAFQLIPQSAEFVKGFGNAWRFTNGQLEEAALIRPER